MSTHTQFQVLAEKLLDQAFKPGSVIVIPVNGYVKNDESAVMGIGLAQRAKKRFPGIEYAWGRQLLSQGRLKGNMAEVKAGGVGNHVAIIRDSNPIIVALPTQWHFKHQYRKEPAPADNGLIDRSLAELALLADHYKWRNVYLPVLGFEEGVHDWKNNVLPYMADYLDHRFVLCTG